MLYSISFKEWQLSKRLNALRELGFSVNFNPIHCTVDLQLNRCEVFGSAHTEAAKFICDPVYNPKLYNMDPFIGRIVVRLHSEFWYWKFNMYHVDIEEEIVIGIKNFFRKNNCKNQDTWLELDPLHLKELVIELVQSVFTDYYWTNARAGEYVIHNLANLPMDTDTVSWKRVHSLLFKEIRK